MQTYDYTPIKQAIERADLRKAEAAKLFQVSRQTIYNWENGNPITDKFRYSVVLRICGLLNEAVRQRLLPLRPDIRGAERLPAIRRAIQAVKS